MTHLTDDRDPSLFVKFTFDAAEMMKTFRRLGDELTRVAGAVRRLDRRQRVLSSQVQPLAIDGHALHRRYRSRRGSRR